MAIKIAAVETKGDLERFIRVPWQVYKSDPAWIPPLIMERRDILSPRKNPYFRHARARHWLALSDGRPVGRITAQIDELAQGRHGQNVGHFGMIEAIDDPDVFAALFETAETWLRSQGMESVLGPFNLSINEECGLLVKGFETPPMLMMGHARPYYAQYISDLGYAKERDLYAYFMDIRGELRPRMARIIRRAEATGRIELRPVNRKELHQELQTILDIFNNAWCDNWGFIPITPEEMHHTAKDMRLLLREYMCYLAYLDGEPTGFMITLPNLNEAIRDLDGRLFPFGWAKLLKRLKCDDPTTCRVPLMGIHKEQQHSTLGIAMALMLIERIRINAVAHGYNFAELSWILEDNRGMRSILDIVGSSPYKIYRVYRKSLR